MLARRVHAVGEQDDRFAAFDVIEVLIDHLIHRVVKPSAVTGFGLPNCVAQQRPIVGWLGRQHADLVIERNDHHSIVGPQLVHKSDRRILNLFQLGFGRSAGVDQQGDREGLFRGSEISDLLLGPVFPNAKIFLAQVGNVLAVPVHHTDGNADQGRVNAHDVAFADLFRAGVLRRS